MSATWWAVMLARDVDACRALLRGEPVDPARLDPCWLARATTLQLVMLDVFAIDLVFAELPEPRSIYDRKEEAA